MIYLLGASGDIGINIARYLGQKSIQFISVSRNSSDCTLGFNDFLKIINLQKNILVINSAKLSVEDLSLFADSASSCTKIIHISSVAVYGNSNFINRVSPINDYGHLKVLEEEILTRSFEVFIIRLSNIFGGNPETSGVLKLYNSNKLRYIEVDENSNELLRDYIEVNIFLNVVYENLGFTNTTKVNVSSGIGLTLTEFFHSRNIDISKVKRKLFNSKIVIKESIVDSKFTSFT